MSLCPSVRRTFSDDAGTFHTLGNLPRRATSRKPAVFHIGHDDDDEHSSSLDEQPPPTVPFPRTSSPPSDQSHKCSSPESYLPPPRPQLVRDAAASVLLSNGKPLKSSLKSSSSSPAMLTSPQAQHMHLRASSEPSTPVATPKNVHFPEKDYALATVRVFSCSARPAALSNGNGDDTETDGEETLPNRFPFNHFHTSAFNYEIDPAKSSSVPSASSPHVNLVLESLHMSPSSSSSSGCANPSLAGSILVRNLAFEKNVAIRFTLDDWQTVSEVGAHYVESSPHIPSLIRPSSSASISEDGRGWDRFTFNIHLEDYAHSLSTRILWVAARYRIDSTYPERGSDKYGPGGEWWDNNGGRNYRISFRAAVPPHASLRCRPRRKTISAPISPPCTKPQPAMTCKEHALGLMVPSIPSSKDVQPMDDTDTRLMPLRAGRLSLCNYAPPTIGTTSSITLPPAGSPRKSSPSATTNPESQHPSDEDTVSPASSTLSTPSVSPVITPRVIINGQPATSGYAHYEEDVMTSSGPGHIADWEWSAHRNPQIGQPTRQHADRVPVQKLSLPPGRKTLPDSDPLYNAFVTQWCFAEGSSPNHNGYDNGGIMV